jgi:nickel/cobalt transporter (NiCoT) family protein
MLFTAGMTLLDSVDSILMLYSYTGFPEHHFRLFESAEEGNEVQEQQEAASQDAAATNIATGSVSQPPRGDQNQCSHPAPSQLFEQSWPSKPDKKTQPEVVAEDTNTRIKKIRKKAQRELLVKRNMMSGLSIVLTLMSIIVAFRYDHHSQRVWRHRLKELATVSHCSRLWD